jgi:hypothetical protein
MTVLPDRTHQIHARHHDINSARASRPPEPP